MSDSTENSGEKPWYWKAEFTVSALSLTIAALALWYSWEVSTTEREINRVDARISNCTAVAGQYFHQAIVYGWPEYNKEGQFQKTVLDQDNAHYAKTALAIGRAAQLCRVSSEDLESCIETKVNNVPDHYVIDVGRDGKEYENPVC